MLDCAVHLPAKIPLYSVLIGARIRGPSVFAKRGAVGREGRRAELATGCRQTSRDGRRGGGGAAATPPFLGRVWLCLSPSRSFCRAMQRVVLAPTTALLPSPPRLSLAGLLNVEEPDLALRIVHRAADGAARLGRGIPDARPRLLFRLLASLVATNVVEAGAVAEAAVRLVKGVVDAQAGASRTPASGGAPRAACLEPRRVACLPALDR